MVVRNVIETIELAFDRNRKTIDKKRSNDIAALRKNSDFKIISRN